MGNTHKWTLPSGTEVETNIEGFMPMGAVGMAAALVAAGVMTQAEADAAIERRRLRRIAEQEATRG